MYYFKKPAILRMLFIVLAKECKLMLIPRLRQQGSCTSFMHNCTSLSFEVSQSTVDQFIKHSSYLKYIHRKYSTLLPFDLLMQNTLKEIKILYLINKGTVYSITKLFSWVKIVVRDVWR